MGPIIANGKKEEARAKKSSEKKLKKRMSMYSGKLEDLETRVIVRETLMMQYT